MSRTYRERGINLTKSDIEYWRMIMTDEEILTMVWRNHTDKGRWSAMKKHIRKVVVKTRRARDRQAVHRLMKDPNSNQQLSSYSGRDSDVWSYD